MTEEPRTSTTVSAADRVAQSLRELIIEGRLQPGEALREAALAESLDVSRNTVREAFRLLVHDRLIEHVPNRGASVRRLYVADVADIYRIRRALEALGLAQVELAALAEVVDEAQGAAQRGDWDAVSTADLRFHQAIVAALDSPRIDRMFLGLLAELRLAFAAMPDPRSFHEPYLRRNRRLLDLVAAGDRKAAAKELESYLTDAEEQLRAAIVRHDR